MKAGVGISARVAIVALLVVAFGGVGCRGKSTTAAIDGGDSALLARPIDGGRAADAGLADSGLSLDDLAIPQPSTEELSMRMRHLLEAVSQNEPELASDVLFPRNAFMATHDSTDPQLAWEKSLSGAFRKAVERNHKRTKGIEKARFVSFELGHTIVQSAPKKHEWKRPLWTAKHSKLSFTIEGKPRHFDIKELTAWRGAWYVTRLR